MQQYLTVLERKENRIVWMHPWQEWPRLIPGTSAVWSYKFTGEPVIGHEFLYSQYKLALNSSYTKMIIQDFDSERFEELSLCRYKCKASWNLLAYLYTLQKSCQGFLPDICIGYGIPQEEKFSLDEQTKINKMISNDINMYYPKIWASENIAELRCITRDIVAKFRRSPAFC